MERPRDLTIQTEVLGSTRPELAPLNRQMLRCRPRQQPSAQWYPCPSVPRIVWESTCPEGDLLVRSPQSRYSISVKTQTSVSVSVVRTIVPRLSTLRVTQRHTLLVGGPDLDSVSRRSPRCQPWIQSSGW